MAEMRCSTLYVVDRGEDRGTNCEPNNYLGPEPLPAYGTSTIPKYILIHKKLSPLSPGTTIVIRLLKG